MVFNKHLNVLSATILLAACGASEPPATASDKPAPAKAAPSPVADPYPSTYKVYPGVATVIRGATIFDGEGGRIENGTVFLSEGKVTAIGGPDTPIPADVAVIDGRGKWVTPGIIDIHFFLGHRPPRSTLFTSAGL